jgi:hypothetical protein
MNTSAGWQLNQRIEGADDRGRDGSLPASETKGTAGSGRRRVAGDVRQDGVGGGCVILTAPMASRQAVGQVDRVGGAHDDDRDERHYNPESMTRFFRTGR